MRQTNGEADERAHIGWDAPALENPNADRRQMRTSRSDFIVEQTPTLGAADIRLRTCMSQLVANKRALAQRTLGGHTRTTGPSSTGRLGDTKRHRRKFACTTFFDEKQTSVNSFVYRVTQSAVRLYSITILNELVAFSI